MNHHNSFLEEVFQHYAFQCDIYKHGVESKELAHEIGIQSKLWRIQRKWRKVAITSSWTIVDKMHAADADTLRTKNVFDNVSDQFYFRI